MLYYLCSLYTLFHIALSYISTEVVLLGQNVNSYWDKEALSSKQWKDDQFVRTGNAKPYVYTIADGFSQRERVVSRGAKKKEIEDLENKRVDAASFETAEDLISQNAGEGRGEGREMGEGNGASKSEQGIDIINAAEEGNGIQDETGENNKVEDGEEEEGGGRFAELLSLVAAIDPDNMRIRFQSPHPKDFSEEV